MALERGARRPGVRPAGLAMVVFVAIANAGMTWKTMDSEHPPQRPEGHLLRYRPEIDGLRAMAVIPVILFHAGFEFFRGGFVGVDVFFVISGYLITTIILSELDDERFSIANFYERRARRILPALFVVLLACLPLAWIWLLPRDLKGFAQSLIAVCGFVSNVLFWKTSGYFETATELKPLLHTWSLAVEEQYYVFFPLFLMLAWRWGQRSTMMVLAVVGVLSLMAAQWGSSSEPEATFYLLPTRGWELLVGASVAFAFFHGYKQDIDPWISQVGGILGLVLIVYATLSFDKSIPFPSLYALVPTLGAALIILFATPQAWVGKLLGHKLVVGVGLISYSAYLWHQPLFAFARHAVAEGPSRTLLGALALASVVLAYFSWRYVELPFRDRRRFSRRQIFACGAVGSSLFVSAGLAGVVSGGFPSRLPANALEVMDTSADVSNVVGSLRKDVFLGDTKNITGALIGDSHAESIAQALGEALRGRGLGLKVLTRAGCPPVRGLVRLDSPGYGTKCHDHYVSVYRQLLDNKSLETVVISARFTLYLETTRFDNGEGGLELGLADPVIFDGIEYGAHLRDLGDRKAYLAKRLVDDIRSLLDAGKRIILVYPIPEAGWDVQTYGVRRALATASNLDLSTSYARFAERNGDTFSVLDALGDRVNLVRIYPHRALCNTLVADRCVVVKDSQSWYRDGSHLSNPGARHVVADIADALRGP